MTRRARALVWQCLAATASARAMAQGTPATAPAGATTTYTTQAGDTCPAIAQRVYGSATRIDVIHTYNALGPMPHRFDAGRTLTLPRVPPAPRAAFDAEVGHVRGNVRAYTPDDHAARVREPLTRGHRVGTLGDSSADVVMSDERSVHLEENTLVVVLGRYSFQTQRRETAEDTRLERGTALTELAALAGAPPPQPIAVSTPAAQVAASEGQTEITVDPSRATRVAALVGQAEVSARGQTVVVPEGSGSTTELGRPPSPPHPLPPRPQWVQRPARLTFLEGAATSALGTYRVPSGAAGVVRWHVQLASDARFRQLIVDQRVAPDVTRFEARELAAGQYYLRVRAVDAARFESQPSSSERFWVVSPRLVPSVPGRRAAVVVADGLYCGLDGADATPVHGPVELTPGRAHTLRCADGAAGEGAVDHAISAADSGLIGARARIGAATWDETGGARRVAIRVMDAAGAPLAGVVPELTAEGVTPDALRPSTEPGTYLTTVRWSGANPGARLHVRAAGAEVAAVEVPAAAPPASLFDAVSTPSGPAPEPRRAFSAGVSAGAIVGFGPLGTGFAAALNGRYRAQVGPLEFLVGLHLGYERFGCAGGTVAPGGFCARPPAAPQDPRFDVEVLSVGVPVGLGLRVGAHVMPYLAVQPQLLLGRTTITPATAAPASLQVGFGLLSVVGLQVAYGAHAPFLEVGYRYAIYDEARLGSLDVGGLALSAGYRVQW